MITVKRRVMVIPKIEKYIGTQDDAYAEFRVFRVDRYTENQADLSVHTFKLVTTDENGRDNIIALDKKVEDAYIDLTWTIVGSDVQKSGTILAQIQAYDISNVVRWNSYIGSFYVEENLEAEVDDGQLNDYRVLSAKIDAAVEEIQSLRAYIDIIQDSAERLSEAEANYQSIQDLLVEVERYADMARDRADALEGLVDATEERSGLMYKEAVISLNSCNDPWSITEWKEIMG